MLYILDCINTVLLCSVIMNVYTHIFSDIGVHLPTVQMYVKKGQVWKYNCQKKYRTWDTSRRVHHRGKYDR